MVPVGGKNELLKPLAIALELELPVYVIFDADTDKNRDEEIAQIKECNRSLQLLLGINNPDEWPASDIKGENYRIWATNLTKTVKDDLGPAWEKAWDKANEGMVIREIAKKTACYRVRS